MLKVRIKWFVIFFVFMFVFFGCSKKEDKATAEAKQNWEQFSLQFAENLANRKYSEAYQMTTGGYQNRISLDKFRQEFEAIIHLDWGDIKPIEISGTMKRWPRKKSSDVVWVYISLGGEDHSEAVTIIITLENKNLKIRQVEFGRS